MLQGGTNLLTHSYAYEVATGRLSTVSDGTHTATYSYLANSDLIGSTAFDAGAGTVLTTARGYDYGARLRGITNVTASAIVTSHTYDYDNVHRRTQATLQDGSHWDYAYNDRNELTGGIHKWSDDMPVDGRTFGYGYDSIGNRLREQVGTTGGDVRTSDYKVNALNQVTQRTVPGVVDVAGLAISNATVTVNNLTTSRHGDYFHRALGVNNDAASVYADIKAVAVQNNYGQEDEDIVDESNGHAFVPQNPETMMYDADGNLAADGRWAYTWDGENRLVMMEAWEDLPAGARKKLAFSYDWQGRRTGKTVWNWNTSTNGYEQVSSERFVYDGWNLIAQAGTSGPLVRSFLWGNDLSGSMDGAGGVGGLLLITDAELITAHFPSYDGNGNVTALVDTSGATTASYEYSPFGQLLRCEGEYAKANPFRFSSKFTDEETGLLYYGYRYYSTALGRWISKDPIEEEGGMNLYAMVLNNSINDFDLLGMTSAVDVSTGSGEAAGLEGGAGQAIRFKNAIKEAFDTYSDFQDMIFQAWDLADSLGIKGADDFLIEALGKGNDALAAELKGAGKFERHHVGTNKGKHGWNNAFQAVFSALGFNSSSELNILPLPGHKGRHRIAYHQMIGERLSSVLENASDFRSARKGFVRELLNIKKDLLNNPNLLRGL